jgi:Xaa-Pro aminopeptidase
VLPLLAEEPPRPSSRSALDTEMRRSGPRARASRRSSPPVPNGGFPHHRPTAADRAGDLLVVDFGALVDGYHSDMTRTIAIGEPSPSGPSVWPS